MNNTDFDLTNQNWDELTSHQDSTLFYFPEQHGISQGLDLNQYMH